jgi:hypothetical protein
MIVVFLDELAKEWHLTKVEPTGDRQPAPEPQPAT